MVIDEGTTRLVEAAYAELERDKATNLEARSAKIILTNPSTPKNHHDWTPHSLASRFTEDDVPFLNRINGTILGVPSIVVPRPTDRVDECDPNHFLYSYEHRKTVATLTLHTFIIKVLAYYDFTPFQLSVNSYKAILGMYGLFKILEFLTLTAKEFANYYQLKDKSKDDPGFYVLSP